VHGALADEEVEAQPLEAARAVSELTLVGLRAKQQNDNNHNKRHRKRSNEDFEKRLSVGDF